MTEEEKNILFTEIASRAPYGVLIKDIVWESLEPQKVGLLDFWRKKIKIYGGEQYRTITEFRPYLRPMSSMTEEECSELENIQEKYFSRALDKQIEESFSLSNKDESRTLEYLASSKIVDYLNSKHFDYRGLIPMGLALEAPEGMYNKENTLSNEKTELSGIVFNTYLKLASNRMWGLDAEHGYVRPEVIEWNGEWYVKSGKDNTYFDEPKCDFSEAVNSGLYKPTGVRVKEEDK